MKTAAKEKRYEEMRAAADTGMKFDWNNPRKPATASKPVAQTNYSSEGLFATQAKTKKK